MIITSIKIICIILAIILIGADAGAAFGSGSSATVFGSSGSSSFLTKLTTALAVIFLGNSLMLAYLATQSIQTAPTSLLDQPGIIFEQETVEQDIPAMIEQQNDQLDSDLPRLPAQ